MLATHVSESLYRLAAQFQAALPYRHVCIDNFFSDSVADQVVSDFPAFDQTSKTNEFGLQGLKAVNESLSSVSPFYAQLTAYLGSDDLHRHIEIITGIQGLRWGGESMYGGGTHENVHGGELDAHVDFNYDDRTKEHRRLNLLIYLNREWERSWGGDFELHSNPRNPLENQAKSYLPMFNRAVLMETNEHFWHGFPKIDLPADKRHLSRKSIALYFYTKDRPAAEVHGGHGTFYIQRPLPESFKPGVQLTPELCKEVDYLVAKRDAFMELAQQREMQASARFKALESFHDFVLSRFRVPTMGWARQDGDVEGYYPDDWLGAHASGLFVAERKIRSVKLKCYVPEHAVLPMLVGLSIDDSHCRQLVEEAGIHEFVVGVAIEAGGQMIFSYAASTTTSGVKAGINGDAREVSALMVSIAFE